MSIPAEQIEPGVRWQRPDGVFTDDPDVSEQYAELSARGEITLKIDNRDWGSGRDRSEGWATRQAHARALVRRAAEDGYSAEFRFVGGLEADGWCVELVGPLTPELAADPLPGWLSEAADLYQRLRLCETGTPLAVLKEGKPTALAPTRRAAITGKLEALAAQEGFRVMSMEWEWGFDVWLRDLGEKQLPARER